MKNVQITFRVENIFTYTNTLAQYRFTLYRVKSVTTYTNENHVFFFFLIIRVWKPNLTANDKIYVCGIYIDIV